MFCFRFKSNFNFAFAFDERSLQRLSVKNTHILLFAAISNCCKYLCSLSRLSQISLNAKIRNVCAKNTSVAKRLFDSVLAKNQIFVNEARWEEIRK